jgi:8-amino-7-oxononanoate synthase
VASLPARITGATAELGPWTNSEMAASIPDGIKSAMRRQGIDFVGDDAGLAALLEELNAGQGTVVRGRRVPTSLRAASLGTTLSTDNAPWLLDHAIDGKPVLPLARAAGMLAETAGLSAPCSLADVTLYQGVSVREPAKLQLSVAQDVAELRMGDTLCYRATVAHGALPISVERRVGGDAPTVPLEAFYGEHTFHGPLLQGITSIEGVGADFVHGTLRVGGDRPVDMLALDSAMQLSAYVAFTRFGRAGTPVSIAEYRQLAPWTDTVHAQAVFGDGQGDRFEADLAFWSPDGTLIAVANGVVARMAARDVQPTDVATRWTNPSEWPEVMALQARMDEVAAMGLTNPYFDLHEGTARDTSRMGGRDVMNFSSYNYLGLSGDERIIEDVYQAMKTYGTSVSASRVASGERPFHRALEAGLAAAQGVEDAIVFPSGHATNVTVIGHLFTEKDLILHDELIHDSCLQGIKLSGAQRRSFKHDDPASLEDQIKRLRGHYERCLILIEGVYSMDGDVANLPEYVRLKEQYGCLLMIDEAHSFGTIGKTGRGISEHYGIDGARVDLWMGTMSKSLASMGGWIAGSKVLMRYLRYTTPGFVFAAGVTPTVGQTALSALGLMQEEPWRVERLQHNSRYFFDQLQANGLDTGPARGESPVIPVITGDSAQALLLAERLLEAGVNAKPIVYPAVPEDVSRLRFFLSALHSEEQLKTTARLVGQILTGVREQLSK